MAKPAQAPRKAGPARGAAAQPGRRPSAARKSNNTALLLIVVGAALVIVVGVVLLQMQSLNRAPTLSGQASEGMAWGPAGAAVKIVEYSNFGCSHCRDFATDQGKRLRLDYEASGKVRFEFKPFSLGSAGPDAAANAAICAADQGRFWDYHDVLFSKQGVSADPFTTASLKQYAAQVPGLNVAAFNSCVDSGQHNGEIRQYTTEGSGSGVQATPTFFINGQRVVGAVPYDDLKGRVEAAARG